MVTQYINLDKYNWGILIYYGTQQEDYEDIYNALIALGCSKRHAERATTTVTQRLNTGLTFTNTDLRMSLICVSDATTADGFVNTAVHEANHVQSHVCEYYGIYDDEEPASYLIGYIVQRMYKMLSIIRQEYYG